MPKLYAARRFYLSPCVKCSYTDPLSLTNRLFSGWAMRDRFGFLNHYGPFDWVDKTDDIPVANNSTPFSELMDNRAKEILAKDCLVTVSWSGGVDSSGIVVALLRNGIEPERLNIIHSASSKAEHPWLYKHLTDKRVKLFETEDIDIAYNSLSDGVLVSGWCADQLFGSSVNAKNLDLYNKPWLDGVKEAFNDIEIRLSSSSLDKLGDVFSAYASYVGFTLERFCEFAWLYNFGVKWSYVSQDSKLAMVKSELRDNVVTFYEALPFQRWAMANFGTLCEHNIYRSARFYKLPLKKYIYEYTNDADYLLHKGKIDSWKQLRSKIFLDSISVYDTDGYHLFKAKHGTRNLGFAALNRAVMHKYFKEGYEE